MEKTRPKHCTSKPPSILTVLCTKIQGGTAPLSPAADVYAYCNECVLSVECRLRFNFWYLSFLITIFKS